VHIHLVRVLTCSALDQAMIERSDHNGNITTWDAT